jgi:ubiquinone/menaquinone biosynthesis C-methylase UbiE
MVSSREFDNWRDVMDWDVANWSGAVRFWQQHSAVSLERAHVLELGAHRGGLSLYAAARGADVVCSDIESPERPASPVHVKYGVEDRITYRAINATAIDFPDATFDLVVFKSVLGGLGQWSEGQATTMAEIARVLKPGGELWFAENLRAGWLHMVSRRYVLKRAWHYPTFEEFTGTCGVFDRVESKRYGVLATFGRKHAIQDVLARVDAVIDPITPLRWKYILFGVATRGR